MHKFLTFILIILLGTGFIFALSADQESVIKAEDPAPVYNPPRAPFHFATEDSAIFEDFEGGPFMPAGWDSTHHHPDSPGFQVGVAYFGNGTNLAWVDDDGLGSGLSTVDTLFTPSLDLSTYATVNLEFWHLYNWISTDQASVWLVVGGTTWLNVDTYTADVSGTMLYDITADAAGQSDVKIAFVYDDGGAWAWYWAIDNVNVFEPPPIGILAVVPDSVGFGIVNLGDTSAVDLDLTNTGGASLTVNSITSDNTDFVVTNVPASIANGATETFTVSFVPSAAGPAAGNITIDHDGINGKTDFIIPVTGEGYDATVYTFPWNEDFENAGVIPAGWVNDPNDSGKDWIFGTSAGHGAGNDHTSGTGYFAYLDDSSPNPTDPSNLLSRPMDLTGLSTAIMKFWYWSFNDGSAPTEFSYLHIDVWDGSLWHLDVADSIGQEAEAWLEATVDLSSYISASTQVRFRVIETASFYHDIGIDDVLVYEPSPIDISPVALVSPVGTDSTCFGANEAAIVTVKNLGTVALDFSVNSLTVNLDISGASTQTFSTTVSTGTLDIDSTLDVTVSSAVDLSAGGVHTFTIITDQTGDGTPANDTLVVDVASGNVTAYPYLEDFETFTVGTSGQTTNGWFNTTDDDWDWFADDNGTTSSATGPLVDHTLGTSAGIYMFTETSGHNNEVCNLVKTCIDLSSLGNPSLSFWYHMHGATMGELHVDIYAGGVWNLDVMTPLIGQQQPVQADPWLEAVVDLSAFSGQTVSLRFRGITGTSFTSDMAVDDVLIYDAIGWCNLQWPPTVTIIQGDYTGNIYGQVWMDGATNFPGQASGMIAELGIGPALTDPTSDPNWTWHSATYNQDVGNNDEYMADIQMNETGDYSYAYRYSYNGAPWAYGDLDGSTNGVSTDQLGVLTVNAVPGTQKVLISEIVVNPTVGEFVEIYNPDSDPVNLSDYYLTDATFASGPTYYYQIVEGGGGGGTFADWHARFPDDSWIQPGEYQTVALAGDSAFYATYGVMPTYELYEDGFSVPSDAPDMREAVTGSISNQGGLTNGDEVVILYFWDGTTDLVQDSDYLIYDDGSAVPNEAVDKTGVSIDGPDAGTDSSTYLDDTAIASQIPAESPGYGFSTHRIDYTEGAQVDTSGNGITGADETSEDLDSTFTAWSHPTPNAPYMEPPPVIVVSPTAISDSLLSGQTSTHEFFVTNEGLTPLYYDIDIEDVSVESITINRNNGRNSNKTKSTVKSSNSNRSISSSFAETSPNTGNRDYSNNIPSIEAIWDLQFAYDVDTPSGLTGIAGAETDGSFLYGTKWSGTGEIVKFDLAGNYIETFTIPGVVNLRDLAYDGQYFYGSDAGSYIREMDFDNRVLVSTITTPASVRSIAYDSDLDGFWYNNFASDLHFVDRTGTLLNTIAAPPSMYGCAYDNLSDGGPYLWIYTGTSAGLGCQVEQYDLATQTLTGVTHSVSGDLGDYIAGGLFLQPNLVAGTYTLGGLAQGTPDLLFGYELGAVSTWISTSPLADTVATGDTSFVTVTFDANGIYGGDYSANINVNSNDPFNPVATVTADLNVVGMPDIAVSPDTLEFDTLYTGVSDTMNFAVMNTGTDVLTVSGMTNSVNAFTILGATSFSLNAGESTDLDVVFVSATGGTFTDNITITSDAASGDADVYLTGTATSSAPIVGVTPDSFAVALSSGSTTTQTMTVTNTGTGSLTFGLTIEEVTFMKARMALKSRTTKTRRNSLNTKGFRTNSTAGLSDLEMDQGTASLEGLIINNIPEGYPLHLNRSESVIPDLMHYKFDEAGTTTTLNYANPATRVNVSATLMGGMTMGGSGQSGAALIGTGGSSGTDYVDTSWPTDMGTADWAISMWLNNVDNSTALYYHFGDVNATSFRCFSGGVAGAGNLLLRGGGLTDVLASGVAPGPAVVDFIYDSTVPEVRAYIDGVLNNVVAQPLLNITGSGPFKIGSYSTSVGMIAGELMDEFKMYNTIPTDFTWLAADTLTGTVPAGSSMDIILTFDAAGMFGGDYHANITIDSNDPVTPSLVVPATMTVTGAPGIAVSPGTLDFGTLFTNEPDTMTFGVENTGTDDLVVSGMATTLPEFSVVTATPFTLTAGEVYDVDVAFMATTYSTFADSVTITHNATPGNDVVYLLAQTFDPPIVRVSDTLLTAAVAIGGEDSTTFQIFNTGASDLDYELFLGPDPFTEAMISLTPDPSTTYLEAAESGPKSTSDVRRIIGNEAIWDVQLTFDLTAGSGAAGNAGAEFDGTYFYTTRWASNLIHKYDATGNLIEEFSIPGVTGLRDLAFDGTYMYGGAAGNTIYMMDFVSKTMIGTIPSPEGVRHIAYDPSVDGFWVGNWTTDIFLVDRSGSTVSTIPAASHGLSSMYGSAYDDVSPGSPYLWVFHQGVSGTEAHITQLDPATGTQTGVTHDVLADLPAASPLAGGLFITTDFVSGKATIGGTAQGTPDMMICYELADVASWVTLDHTTGTVAAGDTGAVKVYWHGIVTEEVHDGYLGVYSNDPVTDWVNVHLQLDVNTSLGDLEDAVPTRYALHQNFPNPFNPITTIKYDLKANTKVKLTIYNVLGQKVRTLVNENQTAGYQSAIWNGLNEFGEQVSTGIYIYRIEAGDAKTGSGQRFVKSRKMVFMK